MSQDVSDKLMWQSFQKEIFEGPLQVFYQTVSNDTYTSSGYSFYIKSPANGMLLDRDVWIKYTLNVVELANNAVSNTISTYNDGNNGFGNIYAASNTRIAFRGGNVMQKAHQAITCIINGLTISSEPWKYVEELNRIFISQEQSRHEFSGSGGAFDNGNHSHRVAGDIGASGFNAGNIAAAATGITIINGFHSNAEIQATGAAGNNLIVAVQNVPKYDYYYNEGYSDRHVKFADLMRRFQAPNAGTGNQYGVAGGAAANTYQFTFYERIPIPPFKMYSNDEQDGVIPNIKDLTIRSNFTSNFLPNIIRSSVDLAAIMRLDVPANSSGSSNCELYLKWYTPPINYSIPAQISMPLRKIWTWASSKLIGALAAADNPGTMTAISEYNISLEAIPDLLLIYYKYRVDSTLSTYPDSYHFEITDLRINLEGQSGKVSQIQTIDLYNKWKSILRHNDAKIPPFDEWRRYMCIACLKPEDYGCIRGPGYDNPVTLGIQFTPRNWWNIPSAGLVAEETYNGTAAELIVTGIFDKWMLNIPANGSAVSSLTKEVGMMKPYLPSLPAANQQLMMNDLRGSIAI